MDLQPIRLRFKLGLLSIVLVVGCQIPRTNAPPEAAVLPPEKPAYFLCDKCGSLDGGSYAEGQTKQLRTPEGEDCVHEWFPISRNEFRELGTERFGIDWKLEGPSWQGASFETAAGPGDAAPIDTTNLPASAQDNPPAAN